MNEKELMVVDSLPKDTGRAIARISFRIMTELELEVGDIIKISKGEKHTVFRVMPAYLKDYGNNENIVQIDEISRKNLKTKTNDKVKAIKVSAVIADYVVVSIKDNISKRIKSEAIKRYLINKPIILNSSESINLAGQDRINFKVIETSPADIVMVKENTKIRISKNIERDTEECKSRIKIPVYQNIGGLKDEIIKIRELVEIPLKYPFVFKQLGIEPPKGILLYGPPGTGKTLIARALARETDATFISISGPEIMQKYYGESEARLREIFTEARENAPSIIFLDEIDAIATKREEVKGEVEKRVVAQLLTLLDGLEERGEIVVIGATNIPDALDPALRRPGRFDREINFGIPDKNARKEILQIHTTKMPLAKDVDLDELVRLSHGYVGADLAALCREAAMSALRRKLPGYINYENEVPVHLIKNIKVNRVDFEQALLEIQPSIIRDVLVEIPEVKWNEVGGLEEIKDKISQAIEWPFHYPEFFNKFNLSAPKGIMLAGPPGVGKTLLVKALANKIKVNFISIKGPELLSKWVGESEKGIRKIFLKARQAAPCIIFFDEIDSLVPARGGHNNEVIDRVVSQFLTELDGIQELENVIVIGATNRLDILDNALLRPGRFDLVLEIPLPDKKARLEILKIHSKNLPIKDFNLSNIIVATEGLSGADLSLICRQATLKAFERFIKRNKQPNNLKDFYLNESDFRAALEYANGGIIKES